MALENVLARLVTMIARSEAKKQLSQYAPPSRDDILHDGLVASGQTWGGILGGAAGGFGGEALGGLPGAVAGGVAGGAAGSLAGGWAAHGAYREGQLIQDILSNPENWTVDAAGAIVPVIREGSGVAAGGSAVAGAPMPDRLSAPQVSPAPAIPYLPHSQVPAGGLPGLIASVTGSDPSDPTQFQSPAGGLLGLIQDYMRNNPVESEHR